mgnify:CR=1 FL=1
MRATCHPCRRSVEFIAAQQQVIRPTATVPPARQCAEARMLADPMMIDAQMMIEPIIAIWRPALTQADAIRVIA